jgi:cytochrome c biogenesis protein CcmG/thiol:disulfide interchange protein DsbE
VAIAPRPPRRRGLALAALGGAIVVAIVVSVALRSDGVVDFGAVPGPDAPPLPADAGLRVDGADPALAPALGSVLTDGGWPEASAFIARSAGSGRPTVVNLFASWCGPCEREMPLLNRVADRELGTDFLGVAHLDARRDAERFVAEQQVVFTTILDLDGAVAAAVGGRGLPVTAAFDRDGRMVGRVFGELTEESLESLLRLVR